MLFGVYLLIRKRAVLRYIYCLRAVCVSLLANIVVLYQILSLISSRFEKNVRDTALAPGAPGHATKRSDWCGLCNPESMRTNRNGIDRREALSKDLPKVG